MALTVAQSLPAGLHLYDTLAGTNTNALFVVLIWRFTCPWNNLFSCVRVRVYVRVCVSDDQQSLYSAGVNSGSDLFVWNGREVSANTHTHTHTHTHTRILLHNFCGYYILLILPFPFPANSFGRLLSKPIYSVRDKNIFVLVRMRQGYDL